jgi:hypothetical protein
MVYVWSLGGVGVLDADAVVDAVAVGALLRVVGDETAA